MSCLGKVCTRHHRNRDCRGGKYATRLMDVESEWDELKAEVARLNKPMRLEGYTDEDSGLTFVSHAYELEDGTYRRLAINNGVLELMTVVIK